MPDLLDRLKTALADRYAIEEEIGAGGMATVYLAEDLKLHRKVAVKVLRPELAAVLGAERFIQEIKTTANLQHPHILPLFDSGEAEGFLYYVMPYVEGESLREKLNREKQLAIDEALEIAKTVAAALGYAHEQGVVHRDIKPENILLHKGEVLVADFGIALAVRAAGGRRLTETGLSLGTPEYMSPEQATADHEVDARSDIYSLAAVLYELLAGEPPHTGRSTQAIIAKLLTEQPTPLRILRSTVPESVDRAVMKALAKVAPDRFNTTGEFAQALREPSSSVPTRERIDESQRWIKPALVALACGVGAGFFWIRGISHPAPLVAVHNQVTFTGDATQPAISPDGGFLAYVAGGRLWMQDLTGGNPIPLADGARSPVWSPDGTALLHRVLDPGPDPNDPEYAYALYTVPRLGGRHRLVVHGGTEAFAYLPDGRSVVHVAPHRPGVRDRLLVVDLSAAESRELDLESDYRWIEEIRPSPDGRWMVMRTDDTDGNNFAILLSSDGGSGDTLLAGRALRSLRWNARSDALYYLGNGDLTRMDVNSRSGKRSGDPRVLISGIPMTSIDISADGGRMAYTRSDDTRHVWLMVVEGEGGSRTVTTQQLTRGTSLNRGPSVSPDGRFVAFSRGGLTDADVYVIDTEGGMAERLTSFESYAGHLQWSPDGQQIAFRSGGTGETQLMVHSLQDGRTRAVPGDRRIRVEVSAVGSTLPWSPDGRLLLYRPLGDDGMESALMAVEIATGRETVVADRGFSWVVSPDGRRAAILLGRPPRSDGIWSIALDGDSRTRLATIQGHPILWSDDDLIYVVRSAGEVVRADTGARREIWIVPADGGEPTFYVELPLDCVHVSMSRDARRVVCDVRSRVSDIWIVENFDQTAPEF